MGSKKVVMSARMSDLIGVITESIEKGETPSPVIGYRQELADLEEKENAFYGAFCRDIKFETSKEFRDFEICLPDMALRYKRILVIIFTFSTYISRLKIADKYTLDMRALTKTVRGYLDDLAIIKKRHGCERIQLPKIAGIMTNLIVRHRPIVPLDTNDNPYPDINAQFAIFHALCVCSDFSDGDELDDFGKKAGYAEFFWDMEYLLNRNFTPENLIMVFKTLCIYQFPSYLKHDVLG